MVSKREAVKTTLRVGFGVTFTGTAFFPIRDQTITNKPAVRAVPSAIINSTILATSLLKHGEICSVNQLGGSLQVLRRCGSALRRRCGCLILNFILHQMKTFRMRLQSHFYLGL